MKITRVRRGFTTNSSGANDWFSPPAPKNQPGGNPGNSEMKVGESRTVLPNGSESYAATSNLPFVSGMVLAVSGLFLVRKIFRIWKQKRALRRYNG